MTKDEISKIKEHIEIHARREPRAIRITEIMRKAVDELKCIAELKKENAEPKWHKVADGDLPNENVKLILVRDRFDNKFLNYHLLLKKMIVEMIDQFDEWIELPLEE